MMDQNVLVDSMSKVLEMQVLTIEKVMISIDALLQSGLKTEIAHVVSNMGIEIKTFISKALKVVSSYDSAKGYSFIYQLLNRHIINKKIKNPPNFNFYFILEIVHYQHPILNQR
jgi:hypothetical protein